MGVPNTFYMLQGELGDYQVYTPVRVLCERTPDGVIARHKDSRTVATGDNDEAAARKLMAFMIQLYAQLSALRGMGVKLTRDQSRRLLRLTKYIKPIKSAHFAQNEQPTS